MSDVAQIVEGTGEILEFAATTPEEVVESLLTVQRYLDAYESLKSKLKDRGSAVIAVEGPIEHRGWRLYSYSQQRRAYNPVVLRQTFDEDLLDTFKEPVKGRIDAYIKEHLDELGSAATRLRQSMIPVGLPTPVVRLERISDASA